MKATMKTRAGYLLAAIVLLPLMAMAAVRDDYATQWPLVLDGDNGGAYRATLDASVYRQLQDPRLRDFVVVNGDGVAVPTELFAPERPQAKPAHRLALPWFALPATAADGTAQGWELVSQADAEGHLRRVEARITDSALAMAPRDALLVDASRARDAIMALELQWQPTAALDMAYRVETSDDLEHWQPLATNGRMVDLQRDGRRLLRRRIELHERNARYLRLTPEPGVRVPTIAGVFAELPTPPDATAPQWLELVGKRVGTHDGDAFEFVVDGRFPVQQVDVVLDGNHAVQWRLESRDDADAPWRLRASPWLAYRVDATGAGNQSPPRVLEVRVRDRHWRLRADGVVGEPPRLRLGYRPETIVFLAQGKAPYTLVAGSTRAHRAASSIPQLLADLRSRHGADWQPASARLEAPQPLAGAAALRVQHDWKSWLLWGVLALGALVIVGFSISLLRKPTPGK